MSKWSIRDLWGRLTQKKALNPDMKNMLMSLDGAYEPKDSGDTQASSDGELHEEQSAAEAGR